MRYLHPTPSVIAIISIIVVGCGRASSPAGVGTEHDVGATLTALPSQVPSALLNGLPNPAAPTPTPFPPEQFGPITIDGYYWTPEPTSPPPTPDHLPQVQWYYQPCEVQGIDIFKGVDRLAVPEGFAFLAADGVRVDGQDSGIGLWFQGPAQADIGAVPPELHVVRRRLLSDEKVEVWPTAPGRLVEKRQYGDTFVVVSWHYPGTLREVTIVDADRVLTSVQSDGVDGDQFERMLQSLVQPSGERTIPNFCAAQFTPRPTPIGGIPDY
jgi:hypothetical protein